MLDWIFTFFMLILLQVVLGFDNLLYIALESKRVEESSQNQVRKIGIFLAVFLRIAFLFVLIKLVETLKEPFFSIQGNPFVEGSFTFHALICLFGGGFILYTATKEIFHMLKFEETHGGAPKEKHSKAKAITMIVLMNLVFSFDSILSAIALAHGKIVLMASAIVVGGVLMLWLANHVSSFLEKNRMYEVLGLFILFIVGVLLLSEGGHLAHLKFFGYPIEPMAKSTFYFVISVLFITEIAQSRYKKKILKNQASKQIQQIRKLTELK